MSKLDTVYYDDYSGGLNNTSAPREIEANESSILQNWDITYKGQLRRRDGITLVGNSIGSNPIKGLGNYLQSNSSRDLLCFEGVNIRYLNSTTWDILDDTTILGNNLWFENVIDLNQIFISNQDNVLRYWDRSSIVLDASLTTLVDAPHGNVMRWHKNHLFHLNNVVVDGVLYANDLFWSNMGDPSTYDTVNNHFSIPGNGRAITAMDLGNNLVLFKERAIQYLSGWGSNSWQVTESSSNVSNVDEQVGICGQYACTRVGNEIWFMDNRGQIRRLYQTDFDPFRHDLISGKVQGSLASMNLSAISGVAAWTHNDKVYFAIPTGTSTVNNLLLVFDVLAAKRVTQNPYFPMEAWTTYEGWFPSVFTSFRTNTTPNLYFGDATTGNVFFHFGVSDNGVAIDADRYGKDDDFQLPERFKTYKFGYGSGQTNGVEKINIYAGVDGGNLAQLDNIDLSSSGSRLGPTGSFLLGPTGNAKLSGSSQSQPSKFFFSTGGGTVVGKRVKLRQRHNVLGEQPIVDGLSVHFKPRELR